MNGSTEVIPDALDGERLDRVVALMAEVSRSRACAAIDDGGVSVDGEVSTHRARRVRSGEELWIGDISRQQAEGPLPDPTVVVPVVHADDDVV